MTPVEIIIRGDPKGQPRPRAYARRMGANFVARVYDSDVADDWKRAVRMAVRAKAPQAFPTRLDDVPFKVVMRFEFKRPKSHLSTAGLLKAKSPVWHMSRPDCDNLAKLVLDQITDLALIWRDDSQVVILVVEKFWARADEEGGCAVRIEAMTDW